MSRRSIPEPTGELVQVKRDKIVVPHHTYLAHSESPIMAFVMNRGTIAIRTVNICTIYKTGTQEHKIVRLAERGYSAMFLVDGLLGYLYKNNKLYVCDPDDPEHQYVWAGVAAVTPSGWVLVPGNGDYVAYELDYANKRMVPTNLRIPLAPILKGYVMCNDRYLWQTNWKVHPHFQIYDMAEHRAYEHDIPISYVGDSTDGATYFIDTVKDLYVKSHYSDEFKKSEIDGTFICYLTDYNCSDISYPVDDQGNVWNVHLKQVMTTINVRELWTYPLMEGPMSNDR